LFVFEKKLCETCEKQGKCFPLWLSLFLSDFIGFLFIFFMLGFNNQPIFIFAHHVLYLPIAPLYRFRYFIYCINPLLKWKKFQDFGIIFFVSIAIVRLDYGVFWWNSNISSDSIYIWVIFTVRFLFYTEGIRMDIISLPIWNGGCEQAIPFLFFIYC
jgi:hypothetical protein